LYTIEATEVIAKTLRNINRDKLIEMFIWIIIALTITGRFWFEFFSTFQPEYSGITPAEIFNKRYFEVVTGIIFLMFPILFQLVFNYLPIELIKANLIESSTKRKSKSIISKTNPTEIQKNYEPTKPTVYSSLKQLSDLAESSKDIAQKLYTRAGVYLFIGVLIAFTGLVFFYATNINFTTSNTSPEASEIISTNLYTQIISTLPRFGILFFIQFIAFFFLRQYRAAMDEYRYFEAIKRRREENYAILSLLMTQNEKADILSFLDKISFYSETNKLSNGETTEILESRKLTKDEMQIFEKIIEVVGKPKN